MQCLTHSRSSAPPLPVHHQLSSCTDGIHDTHTVHSRGDAKHTPISQVLTLPYWHLLAFQMSESSSSPRLWVKHQCKLHPNSYWGFHRGRKSANTDRHSEGSDAHITPRNTPPCPLTAKLCCGPETLAGSAPLEKTHLATGVHQ